MAKQYASQDQNQFPALLGHSGTAGTAETVRITSTNGALDANITGGTVNVDVVVGDLVNTQDQPYALQVDDENSGTTIVGEAAVASNTGSAVWRMKRIVDTGGTEVVITWADGDSDFDNIWTARGTMNFS